MNLTPLCYFVGFVALLVVIACVRIRFWGEKRP